MYPKVKVKVQREEEDDDRYAFEQSSLESLKAFDWLSLHYSVSDESPVSVARVPRSYAPKSPSNPSFLVSKDGDKKKTVLGENRKNVRPSTAPRPRAVLSSPDNDEIIGVKTHTRAKPHSGLKTRPLVQNRHMLCKVFPKSPGAESLAPAKGYDHKESTEPKNNSRPRHHKRIAPSSVHNAPSVLGGDDLGMISNRLYHAHQSIPLENAVAVREVLLVDSIHTVLDALELAAFAEMDDLGCPDAAVSLQNLDTLDRLGHDLGDEGVRIEDEGFEHFGSRDRGWDFHVISDNPHA